MSSVDVTQAPYAPASADGTVRYDARTLARLGQVAAELLDQAGDRVDDPAWVALARHAWEDVPAEIRRTVREFRRHSGPDGALVLRRLPIGAAACR